MTRAAIFLLCLLADVCDALAGWADRMIERMREKP